MTPAMQLYTVDPRSIVLDPTCAMAARADGGEYRIPVPVFLVTRPAGNALCDTGMDPLTIKRPETIRGPLKDQLTPDVKADDRIVKQLGKNGFSPDYASYVILSHLHSDHAGGMRLLPNAEFIPQRAEREMAMPESVNLSCEAADEEVDTIV